MTREHMHAFDGSGLTTLAYATRPLSAAFFDLERFFPEPGVAERMSRCRGKGTSCRDGGRLISPSKCTVFPTSHFPRALTTLLSEPWIREGTEIKT